jgi:NADPH:quinone reductase-like Zn-dependent oxidoreductase
VPGSVRVGVRSAALNPKDAFVRKGRFRFLSGKKFPKRLGLDFAGVVLESAVPSLQPGQRVFGMLDQWDFLRGTLADEVMVRDEECAALPDGVTFEDAAAVALTGSTALQALRDVARVQAGARVLIHGASGGVGTVAVQIGKRLGAHVTAAAGAANLGLCKELGADEAVDRTGALAGHYDCVFDVFGSLPLTKAAPLLARGGVFVSTVPTPMRVLKKYLRAIVPLRERLIEVHARKADLAQLAQWLAAKQLRAIVDRRFPLEQYAAAFELLESKRTRGKISISVKADG